MKVDLNNLLKQAQEMQNQMQAAQEELSKVLVTGEAGGGLVKLDMDGRHTVKSTWLDPSLLKEEKDFIEELLVATFNDAIQKIEKASRKKLGDLTAQIQNQFKEGSLPEDN